MLISESAWEEMTCLFAPSLVHAPGVYERLMQVQETGRPRVEIGLGVGTIFGLIPFLVGCLIFAVVALWLHWRHRRQ
ncbi:DUF2755 family protein [Escherichia coli]